MIIPLSVDCIYWLEGTHGVPSHLLHLKIPDSSLPHISGTWNFIALALLRISYVDLGTQPVIVTYMIFIVILFYPYGYYKLLVYIK